MSDCSANALRNNCCCCCCCCCGLLLIGVSLADTFRSVDLASRLRCSCWFFISDAASCCCSCWMYSAVLQHQDQPAKRAHVVPVSHGSLHFRRTQSSCAVLSENGILVLLGREPGSLPISQTQAIATRTAAHARQRPPQAECLRRLSGPYLQQRAQRLYLLVDAPRPARPHTRASREPPAAASERPRRTSASRSG